MTKFTDTGEIVTGSNRIPSKETYIYIGRLENSKEWFMASAQPPNNIPWTKYQIKETDMRIKTATFSSPQYMDLTLGRYRVLISSPYHENFMGLILSCEYDEDNHVYNYQCQDWSRNYMVKATHQIAGTSSVRYLIINLLTRMDTNNYSSETLKKYSGILAGLRPEGDYAQEKWGSVIKFNPMTEKPKMRVKDEALIETIRNVVYGSGAYIDLWWNDQGVLQVEPYQKDDFFNTGLHLVRPESVDRKFKFDTTNIITGALVSSSSEGTELSNFSEWAGKRYWNDLLVSFFGYFNVVGRDKDLWTALGNKATTTTTTTSTKSTGSSSSSSSSNPFKGRKIWINADNGSDDMKNSVANKLKNKGYTVHVGGTCSNCHYSDYTNVSKDYVYITMYNGFCACTIQEAYSSSIQNQLKKKNVQLVVMFDTRTWTEKMKPYRYGDFNGYTAKRAWDDNFCSFDPTIKNVGTWFKNKGAVYCAYPNADGLVEQFEAGGYFKWKK